MDVFFELPFELTRNLADNWLSVVDIVVLDSAYCQKAKRKPWEEVLRSADQFRNYEVPFGYSLEEYQSWMFVRRIRTTKLVFNADFNNEQCANYLTDMGGFIEEINVQNYEDDDDFEDVAVLVEKHCDHVVSLTFSNCSLGPVMLNLLYKTSLLHLGIHNCTDVETEYRDLIHRDGSHRIKLQAVCLFCKESNWFVNLLLELLDPVYIQRLSIMTDDTIPQMSDNFLSLCFNLRALGFHGSLITDDDLISLVQLCPNLLHLDISDCIDLTDDIAEVLNRNLSSLRTVNISNTLLSSRFLEALATHCSHSLRGLYASQNDYSEEGFRTVLNDCHELCTLECLGYNLHANQNLANLSTLILRDNEDFGLEWIGRHCGKLKHLRLEFHDSDPEDYDFGEMTEAVLPRLQTLSVCCEVENEEPKSLRALRAARPKLHVHYNTDVLAYNLFKLPL